MGSDGEEDRYNPRHCYSYSQEPAAISPRRDRSLLAMSSEEEDTIAAADNRYSAMFRDAEAGQVNPHNNHHRHEEAEEEDMSSKNKDHTTAVSARSTAGASVQFTVVTPARRKSALNYLKRNGEASEASQNVPLGAWLCRPYAREKLLEDIYAANRKGAEGHEAILDTLKHSGVMIYIIDSKVSTTKADVVEAVKNVILHVSKIARAVHSSNPMEYQRCLLYRDNEGRFFNLTLSGHTVSSVGKWRDYLDSFSGLQAMSVLTILCRSFACAGSAEGGLENALAPAYLVLLLGLVFIEEISLSWMNVAMFVRGIPSISAFSLLSPMESDWFRKAIIFVLAIGNFVEGRTQTIVTLLGISMACAALLANLGSRAWRFCGFRPMVYAGPIEPIMAYLVAMLVGAVFPYLGHRQVEAGGKAALESVIRIAFLVAVVIILSDFQEVRQFLVMGTENCSQYYVNLAVGGWYFASLIASLFMVFRIPVGEKNDLEEVEPLLEMNHASPVAFRVPNLPDYSIDPITAQRGISWLDIKLEFFMGVIMALIMGGMICALAFVGKDGDVSDELRSTFFSA